MVSYSMCGIDPAHLFLGQAHCYTLFRTDTVYSRIICRVISVYSSSWTKQLVQQVVTLAEKHGSYVVRLICMFKNHSSDVMLAQRKDNKESDGGRRRSRLVEAVRKAIESCVLLKSSG